MFPLLVLVPHLVTAIVRPHNWSWVHSPIHLSDLVLVWAGVGATNSGLGCKDETLNILYNSYNDPNASYHVSVSLFPVPYLLFVALC